MFAAEGRARPNRSFLAFSVLALATMFAIDAAPAQPWVGRGPWCAADLDGPAYDCAFYSYEQCMATAWGVSNSCSRNPLYVAPQPQVRRLRRAARR